jgi:Integrase zinc binding domain/Integrase core domain
LHCDKQPNMEEFNYNNLIYYLTRNEFPEMTTKPQQESLKKQARNFQVFHNLLYKIDRKTRAKIRVVRPFEMEAVLFMFHNDPLSAHASTDRMMSKMKSRYYWPQMYENIKEYVKSCDICQRRGGYKRSEPLHPIPVGEPFHRIGMDYVGPLPKTTKGNRYIIVAMDYMTKWPEAKPVKEATAESTVNFVYEDIITRHGCPGIILTDRGTHFNNQLLDRLVEKFKIEHLMSTPYHPQTNGLVERFNRTLIEALARTAKDHLRDWDNYIAPILFSYRTSRHSTTRVSPFFLVYGREAKLPTDGTEIEEERSLVHHVENMVNDLPTLRNKAQKQITDDQQKQKDRHDRKLPPEVQYNIGDQVLHYRAMLDKQWSNKLEPKWKGPYYIHLVLGNGAYRIREMNGKVLKAPINGKYLKLYKDRKNWTPQIIIQNE